MKRDQTLDFAHAGKCSNTDLHPYPRAIRNNASLYIYLSICVQAFISLVLGVEMLSHSDCLFNVLLDSVCGL